MIIFPLLINFAFVVICLYINYDWAKQCDEINESWYENSTEMNANWADICRGLHDEIEKLQKRIEELEEVE